MNRGIFLFLVLLIVGVFSSEIKQKEVDAIAEIDLTKIETELEADLEPSNLKKREADLDSVNYCKDRMIHQPPCFFDPKPLIAHPEYCKSRKPYDPPCYYDPHHDKKDGSGSGGNDGSGSGGNDDEDDKGEELFGAGGEIICDPMDPDCDEKIRLAKFCGKPENRKTRKCQDFFDSEEGKGGFKPFPPGGGGGKPFPPGGRPVVDPFPPTGRPPYPRDGRPAVDPFPPGGGGGRPPFGDSDEDFVTRRPPFGGGGGGPPFGGGRPPFGDSDEDFVTRRPPFGGGGGGPPFGGGRPPFGDSDEDFSTRRPPFGGGGGGPPFGGGRPPFGDSDEGSGQGGNGPKPGFPFCDRDGSQPKLQPCEMSPLQRKDYCRGLLKNGLGLGKPKPKPDESEESEERPMP